MSFEIPKTAREPDGCPATAPDDYRIPCLLEPDHDGPHRNNQTIWRDFAPPDLARDTDAWQDGHVVFADEREPDLYETDAA